MNYLDSLRADPLWVAFQVSAKKVHRGTHLPHDRTIVDIYLALEDKTSELKAATLKLALLEEHEPTARAATAYGQLMRRMGKA